MPTRPVVVRAAPTLTGVSRVRLPSASPDRCDGPAMESFHLHSVMQRLVAHEDPDPGLGPHRAILPLRAGVPEKQTHDYRRNGTTSLFAALEVATGKVTDHCYETAHQRRIPRVPQAGRQGIPATRAARGL